MTHEEHFIDKANWRDQLQKVLPELKNQPEYSIILRGARKKEGLTQKQLAQVTGIPQGHISAMENGKMIIDKNIAKQFSEVLKVNYKIFL